MRRGPGGTCWREPLWENPTFVLLGLVGLGLLLGRRTTARAALVLGLSSVAGLLGLFVIRAPLMQYHLTFLPQLALLGALAFVTLLGTARPPAGTASWAALLLGLTACVLPPGVHLFREQAPKDSQLAVIEKVRELTSEASRVLDCWSGLYLTRLPAYRYFFLNSDVLRMLDPAQLEADLHARLDDRAVEVVLTGRHYWALPASVRDRVEQEFVRVKGFPILRYRPAAERRDDG